MQIAPLTFYHVSQFYALNHAISSEKFIFPGRETSPLSRLFFRRERYLPHHPARLAPTKPSDPPLCPPELQSFTPSNNERSVHNQLSER